MASKEFEGDAGAPLPDFSGARNISLTTVAPALGVKGQAQPDYLDFDQKGRGVVVTMFANAGLSYLVGIGGGGLYGLQRGISSTPSSKFKVQVNSVLNNAGRYGSRMGNTLGVFAVMYSLFEGLGDNVSFVWFGLDSFGLDSFAIVYSTVQYNTVYCIVLYCIIYFFIADGTIGICQGTTVRYYHHLRTNRCVCLRLCLHGVRFRCLRSFTRSFVLLTHLYSMDSNTTRNKTTEHHERTHTYTTNKSQTNPKHDGNKTTHQSIIIDVHYPNRKTHTLFTT